MKYRIAEMADGTFIPQESTDGKDWRGMTHTPKGYSIAIPVYYRSLGAAQSFLKARVDALKPLSDHVVKIHGFEP